MDIQEKIKERRLKLGLTLEDVADSLGVNKSTVMRYETKSIEKMPVNIVPPLAKILQCTPEYLMGWDNDYVEEIQIKYDDYFPLHYCTNLSAGTLEELLEAEPDAIVYVPIKYQMMKKRLHAFKVNGDSMDNIIEDGSIVIAEDVKHLSRIKDGTIVVAWCNGEATVKRLYYNDIQITLMPDSSNKVHKPILINTEIDTVHIIGRVIWHMNPDDMEERY